MTVGGLLRVRAAMKPISTVMRPLQTVDVDTRRPEQAFRERSDVCAVPAAGVVAEQMVAVVLAQEAQRMAGGDTLDHLRARRRTGRDVIAGYLLKPDTRSAAIRLSGRRRQVRAGSERKEFLCSFPSPTEDPWRFFLP